MQRHALALRRGSTQAGIVRLAPGDNMLDVGFIERHERFARVG